MSRGKRCRKEPRRPFLWAGVLAALAVIAAAALVLPRLAEGEPDAPETPEPLQNKLVRPEPEPAPVLAELLLEGMTLREKVCQLFVASPSDLTGSAVPTEEAVRQALESWPVGGIIYDKSSLVSQEQTRTMLAQAQGGSPIPLLLTCDEEGGRVNRLMGKIGTTWVGAMLQYESGGPEAARTNARTIGTDMAACGFNLDLAPVADVWSNPANKVIGDRAYSTSFQRAAELIPAAVEGFHQGGVACTLKHFPGHGDTSSDSHYGSVYVGKPLDQLRREELLPFQAGIDAGADAVMMGHLIVRDAGDQPALFSYELVTELLREEMGFEGVVISDSLQMKAMTDHYASGEIAVSALEAGVDLLLCPLDLEGAVQAVLTSVEEGSLSEARIDESVLRVLRLKENAGLLDALAEALLPPEEPPAPERWRRPAGSVPE